MKPDLEAGGGLSEADLAHLTQPALAHHSTRLYARSQLLQSTLHKTQESTLVMKAFIIPVFVGGESTLFFRFRESTLGMKVFIIQVS